MDETSERDEAGGSAGPAEPAVSVRRRRWTAVLLVACAAIVCLLLSWTAEEIWEAVVERTGIFHLDVAVHDWFAQHRVPVATVPLVVLSIIGGQLAMPVLVGALTLLLCRLRRSWQPLVFVAIAAAGSLAMTSIGKEALGRARPPFEQAVPPLESSASFPSGHSLNSLVLVLMLLALAWPVLRSRAARLAAAAGASLFVLAMGFSRVYLGHHWPSDVLAAWLLGAAWLLSLLVARHVWLGERRLRRERRALAPRPPAP